MSDGPDLAFLQAGEQLLRIHHFRFVSAQGCALGSVEVLVEEALGRGVAHGGWRCLARPHHPQLVAKPDYAVHGDSVEVALRGLVERLRSRPLTEAFLPSR